MANEGDGEDSHPQVDLFFLAERLGTNQKCLVVVDFSGSAGPKEVKEKARNARKTIPNVPRSVNQIRAAEAVARKAPEANSSVTSGVQQRAKKPRAPKAQEDIPIFPNGVKQMTYVIVPTVEKEWFRLKAKANNENANNENANNENANNEKAEGKVDEWADEEYDEEVDDKVDDNAEVACVVGGHAARRLMGPLVPVASMWVDHSVSSKDSP
jgi:hypothetical protein